MIEKTIINGEEHGLPTHKVSIRDVRNGDEPEMIGYEEYVPIEDGVIVQLYFLGERWPQRVDGIALDGVYYDFAPGYVDTTEHNIITGLVIGSRIFIWDRFYYSPEQ